MLTTNLPVNLFYFVRLKREIINFLLVETLANLEYILFLFKIINIKSDIPLTATTFS